MLFPLSLSFHNLGLVKTASIFLLSLHGLSPVLLLSPRPCLIDMKSKNLVRFSVYILYR
eukprot:c23220_g2_i1 orf=244-420(+)